MSQEKTSKHSIKVPKLYKVATSILKDFKNGQGSIKTLVYDARKKHPNVKALLALVNECVRYENRLLKAFNDVNLLENEKPLDQSLALILATELLIGKKTLPGESKPILTLLRYQSTLEKSFHSEKNMNEDLEIFTLRSHFWQSHKNRDTRYQKYQTRKISGYGKKVCVLPIFW